MDRNGQAWQAAMRGSDEGCKMGPVLTKNIGCVKRLNIKERHV